jgi:serine phosphatase RsbU (regulator of sigma subunit)
MKLRTKLILAFLLLSVIPLTAVTLYSYTSSLRAFHRTVEAQSGAMAREMGQRMELVTADLGKRVDRLSRVSEEPVVAASQERDPEHPAVRDYVVKSLGDAALFLERLEFVPNPDPNPDPQPERAVPPAGIPPTPPPPPGFDGSPPPSGAPPSGRRRGLRMGGPPRAPRPPGRPPLRKWVVDLSDLKSHEYAEVQSSIASATAAGMNAISGLIGDDMSREIRLKIQQSLRQASKEVGSQIEHGINTGLKEAAESILREAGKLKEQNREIRRAVVAAAKRFDIDVRRDGEVVGTINAKLNTSQLLATVLSATRREQGEIPFAIDSEHQIYTPLPRDRRTLESLDLLAHLRLADAYAGAHADQDETSTILPNENWVVVTRKDASGVTFGIARPVGDSLREIRRASGRNLGLGLGVIGLAFIGIIPLSSRMTRNLATLDGGVRQLAKGDLAVRVPVRSNDEVGQLAQAFNQMAQDLEAHQKLIVEQQRLHRELELCRRIQTEMLPKEPLWVGLTEVKGVSIPAREVGGDFFNYFMLPGGDLAVLVGDVSGKGVSAALLMANIQATLRARLPLEPDLVTLVATLDQEVERNTPRGVYVTLFVGIFDPARKVLRYVNAGHNPQFVVRVAGGLERLSSTGLPVGLFAGHEYQERTLELADGDLLFFFTDGMVETLNEQGDMFGAERLEALLMRAHSDEIGPMLATIEASVREFRGKAEPYDDATMMALRLGKKTEDVRR